MSARNPRRTLRRAAGLAVLLLGGALAAPAGAAALGTPGDVTLFEMVPGPVYLNGGVGKLQAAQMRRDAPNWPLRMTFSDQASDRFVAGVRLRVFDHDDHVVLRLNDAGPITLVQLPQGDYRITARYRGQALTRNVHIGPQGSDADFHWQI